MAAAAPSVVFDGVCLLAFLDLPSSQQRFVGAELGIPVPRNASTSDQAASVLIGARDRGQTDTLAQTVLTLWPITQPLPVCEGDYGRRIEALAAALRGQ